MLTTTLEPTMLDCGHLSTPRGLSAGYATTPADLTICYRCALDSARMALERITRDGGTFGAYVSDARRSLSDLSAAERAQHDQFVQLDQQYLTPAGSPLHHDGRVCPCTPRQRFTITTWPGDELMRITGHTVSRSGFGWSEIHRWWATDDAGRHWYGSNSGAGMFIALRRVK